MMKRLVFLVAALAVLVLLFGCTTPAVNTNTDNGGSNVSGGDSTSSEVIFLPPSALPAAVVGTEYSYSFCKPQSAILSHWSCGGAGSGGTTEPSGGLGVYFFSIQYESLPYGLSYSDSGLLEGTPQTPGTYTFDVCVSDNDSGKPEDRICKPTSITVAPKPPLNLTALITIDSTTFVECEPGDIYNSGYWKIVVKGTMSSNVTEKDEWPIVDVDISPMTEDNSWGVRAENLNCGEWKVYDGNGKYFAQCVKEPGDPETTTWQLNYSRGGVIEPVEVIVRASIGNSPVTNPPAGGPQVYFETQKSVGTC